MRTITEYVITINEDYHSVHGTLKQARKIFRSLVNVGEIESKDINIQLSRKTTTYKVMQEYDVGDEPIYSGENFADTINL